MGFGLSSIPQFGQKIPALAHVADLISGRVREDEDDMLFEMAAEQQIEEERGQENTFLKALEMLGRPQHAVAGVIHDMMDGGDFSPFDRVGQALLGQEHIGMQDVLEEILPGEWDKVRMPDWMPLVGGERLHMAKGPLGFLGDVVTDPLMHLRVGKLTGKLLKGPGAQELGVAQEILSKSPALMRNFERKLARKATKLGAGLQVQQGALRQRELIAEYKRIYDALTSRPGRYIEKFPELQEGIEAVAGKFPAATVTGQFARGERRLLELRLGFGLDKLGIPSVNMLPGLDRKIGESVAQMFGNMMDHVAISMPGRWFKKAVVNSVRYKTGNIFFDDFAHHALASGRASGKRYGEWVRRLEKAMGKDIFDDEKTREILDFVQKPLGGLGGEYRVVPKDIREPVRRIKALLHDLDKREIAAGVPKGRIPYGKLLEPKEQFNVLLKAIHREREQGALVFPRHWTLKEVEKEAAAIVKRNTVHQRVPSSITDSLVDEQTERIIQADLAWGARNIKTQIQDLDVITGYFPRRMTNEAKDFFDGILNNNKIMYKGELASKMFYQFMRGRTFKNLTVQEINDAFVDGTLPHDFIDHIMKQARNLAKGDRKLRGTLGEFMTEMGPTWNFFTEDPVQALRMRVNESLRAVTQKGMMEQIVKTMGRKIDTVDDIMLGEKSYILSPEGMKSFLGAGWRDEVSDEIAKAYDNIVANSRLKNKKGLDNAFLEVDSAGFGVAKAADVPVYGLPSETVDDLNRYISFRRNPEELQRLLNVFDYATDMWKGTTLALFPGFHARNFIGGLWNMALAGTAKLGNLRLGLSVMHSAGMLGRNKWGKVSQALRDIVVEGPGGKVVYDGPQVWKYAHNYGVLTPYAEAEFAKPISKAAQKLTPKTIPKKALKQFTHEGVPVQFGFEAGNRVENWLRMSHFIGALKKGNTPWQAAMDVKKYFHDYAELAHMEKAILRRAMPFYSWSRKNIPLQLEALVTQPQKYAQLGRGIEALQSEEAKNMDPKLLPKWAHEQLGIPTRINKATGNLEVSILRSWLPAADLMAIVHSNPIHASARHVLTLAHPIPKSILEQHINYNVFTERPLEEFPGEPQKFLGAVMSKRMAHSFKNIRLLSEIDRFMRDETREGELEDLIRYLNATGLITKIRGFDPEKLEKRFKFDVKKRTAQLKRSEKSAKATGDEDLIAFFENMREDIRPFLAG
jgi:hypothetical protein